jgi:hypothetical protein
MLIVTAPLLFLVLIQNNSCNSKSVSQPKSASSPTTTASVDMRNNSAMPSPTSQTASNKLPPGTWGGLHVNLQILEAESSLEFDCGHGTINEPILLDSGGHFEVSGSYTREGPGPARQGAENQSRALYSGIVKDDTMTLSVRLDGSSEAILDVSLTRAKQGKLRKCY